MRNNPVDYRLSAWIREHDEFKKEPPKITTYFLDSILKNLPNYKTSEKQLLLLRAIERRTDHPGSEVVMLADHDYPLVWAKNPKEMIFFIGALADRKLIKVDHERLRLDLIVTAIQPDGWDYLDKYSVSPIFRDRAFVAMSFDKALEQIWENGIKPAIAQAGYKPYRIDKEPHIDRIDAKIIADIKDSLFMVVDVTQQKQGVYFEAGYALALNRPVIWCVREDELCNVHFDTRQYNHIVWKTFEDLQENLYNLICAVIGKKEI
jgi:nucleoside 2-deoxyribosyltransferase